MNPSTTTPQRFPPLLIALHWLTLLLAVAVVVLMEFKGNFPKGSPERTAMVAWHYTLGITLLVITALRLVVRLRAVRPPIVPPSPKWQERVAFLVEVGLYVLLIGLPILGWLTVSANGGSVWFWGTTLPSLLGEDKVLGKQIKEVHETLANLAIWLVGPHAAAALYHRYILRDNTLQRMLPGGTQAR